MSTPNSHLGFEVEFLAKPIDFINEYLCTICKHICVNPRLCIECENLTCHKCLKPTLTEKKSCLKCHSKMDKIVKVQFLVKKLNQLRFVCGNKANGCDKVLKYEEYDEHRKTCPFFGLKCIGLDCGKDLLRKDLDEHESHCISAARARRKLLFKDYERMNNELLTLQEINRILVKENTDLKDNGSNFDPNRQLYKMGSEDNLLIN
jgi:hypothetical protein